MSIPPQPAARERAPNGTAAGGRLGRLALKELREILRDRRTILTLVLMPLLLYPLLSLSARQFFLAGVANSGPVVYKIGVEGQAQRLWLDQYLEMGRRILANRAKSDAAQAADSPSLPFVTPDVRTAQLDIVPCGDLELSLQHFVIDAAVRFARPPDGEVRADRDLAVDLQLLVLDENLTSLRAAEQLEHTLSAANEMFMTARLNVLRAPQRANPVTVARQRVTNPEPSRAVNLVTLAPLILILMTITGAVYPAIDLTAGERERGTLEVLVAAPVPRLSLLLAKYSAVVLVACLTATINLVMMTFTISVSGLGTLLFGQTGLTPYTVLQVFGLMLLFAAFFSAVLLAVASFARSFKEAQAYLVPLMLASITPGLLSIMPGLELSGPLTIAPLINIVLLARDLFEQTANPAAAAVVVLSTLLYALGAIAVAARFFGAEAVLYSSQSGWSHLFQRPRTMQPVPTTTSALFCLAIMFPLQFTLVNGIAQASAAPVVTRLLLASLATGLLFGVTPAVAAWLGKVRPQGAFPMSPRPLLALAGGLLLGTCLWPLAHEVVVLMARTGMVDLAPRLEQGKELVDAWRRAPLPLVLIAMAIVPAAFEEFFFRGYLLGALASTSSKWKAIAGSAVLFGLFHLVTTDSLAFERLLPSTLLGVVLGYVRLQSGSLLPCMLIHALHNGMVVALAHGAERIGELTAWLDRAGWSWLARQVAQLSAAIGDETLPPHVPAFWLIVAATGALAGAALVWAGGKASGKIVAVETIEAFDERPDRP